MPTDTEHPVILCQDTLVRLPSALTLADGSVIPKGALVLLLPQTTSECVLTPDGTSLGEAWDTISRDGHTHPEIVQFSEELIRFSTRLASLEAKLQNS